MQFKFTVTILGSGAAIPLPDRNPTAHLVNVRNRMILLDCGEGTQMQLRQYAAHPQKISHIFISHLHGDHYYGLIGLINTFHLLGRKTELHLYSVPALKEIIDLQLEQSNTILVYPLIFHPIETEKSRIIFDDDQISVQTIPLLHRIPTCGFLIREKPEQRKISKEFVKNVRVPISEFDRIKNGADFTDDDGTVYPNHLITEDPLPVRSYAYCTDTAYHEKIIPVIKGCDLLYHEATFAQDKQADARAKFHSTAREAAMIAAKAGVKKLLIGHYSARYKELDVLLNEAREIFPETYLAQDGLSVEF